MAKAMDKKMETPKNEKFEPFHQPRRALTPPPLPSKRK
jgi:hypothetical protein